MPIGAALGGAAIAGVGTVAAGALSSSAQTKAARTAADSSLQVADLNNQLIRDTRNENVALATPFYNNGVAAGNALNGLLLGTPSPAPTGALSPPPTPAAPPASGYSGPPLAQIMTMPRNTGQGAIDQYLSYYQSHPNEDPGFTNISQFHGDPFSDERAANSVLMARNAYLAAHPAVTTPSGTVPAAVPASAPVASALSPWDQFRNSTNYQFRYDQGLKATEDQYATKGALDSGAAEKAKITFGQNFASNEIANYMNLLAGQQNVGLSAGNAVMGVSTNATNAITAQNTNAGNTAANAALVSGNANANMWGTVGNAAGQIGGALFQYGMGQQQPRIPTTQSLPNYSNSYFGVP